MAISQSTRLDLLSLGFKDVSIVHTAVDILPPPDAEKESVPTLIYLGRLTKSKRVDHALRAFKYVIGGLGRTDSGKKGKTGIAKLWIVGSGSEEGSLRKLSRSLGISDSVEFFGKVDETMKARLLSRAHIALFPAVREGWGLVVLEANACGTPVIGYDVPGLRDSIVDNVNGFIVPSGDFSAMGEKALSLLADRKALSALSEKAKGYSKGFSWERCVDDFMAVLGSADGGEIR
jgi:glycosyltransferase involved in cell wall biosynthesis